MPVDMYLSETSLVSYTTGNQWDVDLFGNERLSLEKRMPDIQQDERDNIFLTAARILGYCPDPNGGGGRHTGLALGKSRVAKHQP